MPDDLDDDGSMSRFERAAAPDDNCGSGLEPPNNGTGPQGNVDSNDDCSPHPNFVSTYMTNATVCTIHIVPDTHECY